MGRSIPSIDDATGLFDADVMSALGKSFRRSQPESVLSFGATGDGVTDDTAALQAAVDAKVDLYFPPLSYRTTKAILVSDMPGTTWQADGATIVTSDDVPMHVGKATNAAMIGLGLISTKDDASEHYAGVLTMDRPTVDGLRFTRCYYSAPKRAINGVKVILDDQPAGSFKHVRWIDCTFQNIGRMALEVQDHSTSKIARAVDVLCQRGTFTGVGNLSQGIVCSWSGAMIGCGTVDSTFVGGTVTCIEYVDGHISPYVHGNTFQGLGDSCSPIAFTNPNANTPVLGLTMRDNKSLDRSGGSVTLRNCVHPVLCGNYFTLKTGYLFLRNVLDLVSVGDTYDTNGVYAIYGEGTTQNCRLTDTVLATNLAGTFSMVRFSGSSAFDNVLERPVIKAIVDGSVMDDISGAYGNYMIGHKIFGQKSTGVATFDVTNADAGGGIYEQSAELMVVNGTNTVARTLLMKRGKRRFSVSNNTGQVLTVSIGTGATVAVPAGSTQPVMSTGAAVLKM